LVWARRNVVLDTCPKPYITAESQSLIEEFFVRRRLRAFDGEELSARQVEAFVILEKELAAEMNDGRHNTRNAP
jgi:DNA replicative helicase MCM subunit Mcm2 (Cdc46/Mcm family)